MDVRIESKPAFRAWGRKIWISGQDNEQFGAFWDESHRNGLVERLKALCGDVSQTVTKARVFGVSCVENDPNDRAFDFFIAAEGQPDEGDDLLCVNVPAATWAIFRNRGELPMSLVNAEMHAFMEWLPASGARHALAPELEVYPADDDQAVEFWLPITK